MVLHDINLSVNRGELLGIVGPNGAGKTTLMRAILGLLPAATGSVEISHPHQAREFGYVPQRHEFAWDFPIRVEEAVLTGRVRRIGWLRRPRVEDYQAVERALELVQLSDKRHRPVGELSGGQRQRVLVARALALDPTVLLLDEPFTGLDVPTQELLTDLFFDLASSGSALMMNTHDLPTAMHTCTRLCLLNGTVVAAGTPAELRDPAAWIETFSFRADSPLLPILTGVTGVTGVTEGEAS